MSDPVRITNPGAESLGYDSDGHEIMVVDIYVNPPRVDVFHGTPPAWSSFGNKTIWGGYEWVDDSPTRSDIEKRDKEITAYKNTLSAQQKENENKRTEAGKRLSAAIAAREKDENTLKTLRAGNADAADITRQEFRLLQAELREFGFRTEIAGYDALRLHTESRMLFADADSLRISPREARSLIEQAEKRQKDAQNADKKAADMLAEYERRKGILDTRLSELEKNGEAALAVLDAQQARLLEQQTRNDRAISEARNKLSSVTESLNTARNALTRAEQQLTQQKNTPDGKTIVSPEKFPGRSSTNHSIVVSGDPRFAGTIKITTSAVIDNRANLNYLLTHSGLDYKRNILNDRNPVVTEDVEGDKKIYNAEVAEWDKLRQRLLDARNKITSAESAVNSARNNLSARTNEQKHANDALNALLKEKENIRNQLAGINQKIAEEKRKQDELKATKDAINFTTEFLKSVSEKYGAKAEQLAREMAGQAKGRNIRNVEEALKTYEKYRADINKKINAKDRAAIAAALESVKLSDISSNLNRFSRGLGYAGKITNFADWITEFGKAARTDNWRPFFVKTETIIAGNAATALVALVFSILTGSALGIIGYGLLMAVTGALIDEALVEKANKFFGI
ncbi:TPA: colicin [Escherichia coli]|uniref:colicin-like pore-forming protein n=1 Tax=Escherichia coli TaxID=562 RepID=UPI00157CFA99|nr:colicin-like pore-forming protein [Escherichia coli]EEV6841955.1 colicin [Escherichia coli]EFH5757338.1 colicin [Escherichia coli]EHU0062220.1 colicin [Escherichia coli]MCI5246450.1 colicin [Escherichia coli]MDM8704600.1 colicin-like pore-forming protein [Escherichia coli]